MSNLAEKSPEDIVNSINIPPQPAILLKVQKELEKAEPDINVLSEAISHDVFLSASLLQLLNSSYFGMRFEIKSVQHALTLLGMRHIYNLMASTIFRKSMEQEGFRMPRFWDNAIDVASLSAFLAKKTGLADPDEAYTVGLFFDCGMPVLARNHGDYREILSRQNKEALSSFTELEDQHYDTNHAIIGYHVIGSWNLPEAIGQACLHHHDLDYLADEQSGLDQHCRNLIVILKLAEHVAGKQRQDAEHEWQRYEPFILNYPGLEQCNYDELVQEMLAILDEHER